MLLPPRVLWGNNDVDSGIIHGNRRDGIFAAMGFTLTPDRAVLYLAERGLIAPTAAQTATAELLGGGVSNVVVRVQPPDGNAALVIKQSLPKLRVEEDWFADRERIYRERAGIDWLSNALPHGAIPQVVHEDRDNFLFVMTAAPGNGVNWKDALLAGDIDVAVAGQVGSLLGIMHRSSCCVGENVPAELQPFADLDCFVQLRIDPYHRATATAHPDLADAIEEQAQRMLAPRGGRRTLVHGDYSPKNVIVNGSGPAAQVFLLDFEVVHLGNPVFDLAFMLNHFTLKAIHRPELAERYNAAARSFWQAYLDAAGDVAGEPARLERDTVAQLGPLLLARIDGKSPVEYITDHERKEHTRRLARHILTGATTSWPEIHSCLAKNPP